MDGQLLFQEARMDSSGVWYHWSRSSAQNAERPRLSDDDVATNRWSQFTSRHECWLAAVNKQGSTCRFILYESKGRLFPPVGAPFCWLKFKGKGFTEPLWLPCLRIPSPHNIKAVSKDFATIEVTLPYDWIPRFVAYRFDLSAHMYKKLPAELSINIELVNAAMPLPEVTTRFDKATFCRLQQYGVQKTLEEEKYQIDGFNYDKEEFNCWLLKCDPIVKEWPEQDPLQQWTVIVNTCWASDLFPPMLDWCNIGFVLPKPSGKYERQADLIVVAESRRDRGVVDVQRRGCRWFSCVRVQNPQIKFEFDGKEFDSYATFNVILPAKFAAHNDFLERLSPVFNGKALQRYQGDPRIQAMVTLPEPAHIRTRFWRILSETTASVEMRALSRANGEAPSSRLGQVLEYLMRFEKPGFQVNLFAEFPHIQNPADVSSPQPQELKDAFKRFDQDQVKLYHSLASIPCGILMIPAPSGTGKTYFISTLLAMMASPLNSFSKDVFPRPFKLLVQSDTNQTADDLANSIQKLFTELNLHSIKIVRCRNWNHERIPATSTGINSTEQPAHKAQARKGLKGELLVDTMREFCLKYAKERLQRNKIDVEGDSDAVRDDDSDLRELCDVDTLMREALRQVDIIVTTPTGAAKLADNAGRSWLADGVIVDNASRIREASILVSLTKFPEAKFWSFVGSHQQTRPFVLESKKNLAMNQLRMSTLARYVTVTKPALVLRTKYRVYGGIHELPNQLFFQGQLRLPEDPDLFPDNQLREALSARLVQYIEEKVTLGRKIDIPRVLVTVQGAKRPRVMQGGTSVFNVEHQAWVMGQLGELRDCLRAGYSILIVTPYAESARQYKYAIRRFLDEIPKNPEGDRLRRTISLEARTIDAAQGHTADVVFVDFVQNRMTDHIRDVYRLCVGLNLARHAEIILMHEDLVRPPWPRDGPRGFMGTSLAQVVAYCKSNDLVVSVPRASLALDIDQLKNSDPVGSQRVQECNFLDGSGRLGNFARANGPSSGPRGISSLPTLGEQLAQSSPGGNLGHVREAAQGHDASSEPRQNTLRSRGFPGSGEQGALDSPSKEVGHGGQFPPTPRA